MVGALLVLWATAQGPDSAARERVVVQALKSVQDSLDQVRGAAFNFRTDLEGASPVVLFNRAQRMQASCAGAGRALVQLDSVLVASYPKGEATGLRREARTLRGALEECQREYDTASGEGGGSRRWEQRADSVRAWAPYRLRKLDEAVRRYSGVASSVPRAHREPPKR